MSLSFIFVVRLTRLFSVFLLVFFFVFVCLLVGVGVGRGVCGCVKKKEGIGKCDFKSHPAEWKGGFVVVVVVG